MTRERTDDLSHLKNEAVTRAREMQKRAKHDHSDKNELQKPEPRHSHSHDHDLSNDILVCRDIRDPVKHKKPKDLFASLKLDEETLLILALIVLLIKEKADISIIVALLYLLI